ncbi:MAG: hypothetical protein QOD66_1699, partial [Solirubrobacteraceae bacterium]|nr:hypothetical protein [Solirubrobacteraceae bacterium]
MQKVEGSSPFSRFTRNACKSLVQTLLARIGVTLPEGGCAQNAHTSRAQRLRMIAIAMRRVFTDLLTVTLTVAVYVG